jgi:hypothetical protein
VLTHFVQMMIFMSHQYGFRLPLPMYGPMIVVAARSLVALGQTLGRILHARVGPPVLLGAATIAVMLAALWTAREFVRQPDVEADVFGLGGDAAPAARAVAQTPESWQVDRLYFAGQDGRSFGTAYLPGLAYREMKWFDVNHAFVWPSEGKQGMRLLPPSMSTTPRNLECWNRTAPGSSLRELPGGANSWVQWLPGREQVDCEPLAGKVASFGRLVELLHVTRVGPREAEVRAAWRVAQRPSFRTQLVLESLDATGEVVATRLVDPYPSRYWETGELIIAQVVPPADERAPAEPRQLAIGFTRGTPGVRLTIDDPLALYNRTRIVIDE